MKKLEQPIIYFLGILLILGGVYTLYNKTVVLVDLISAPARAAHVIPITIVCSLICSVIYLISGVLFLKKNKQSTTLLFIATIIMFIGYIGMLFHIHGSKPFELQVIPEMLIRTTGTMLYAAAAWYFFTRMRLVYPDGHDARSFKKFMKEYQENEKDYANPNYR